MVFFDFSRLKSSCQRYQLIDCVVALVLLIATSIVYVKVSPFCRPFSWNDSTINYPFTTNVTFPVWVLVLLFLVVLFFYLGIVYFLGGPLWPWVKVQFVSFALQQSLVNVLKLYGGRIRPDYLNRLRYFGYNENSYAESSQNDISISDFYCQLGDAHAALREGRLSFPSGHSSASFAIFTGFSLFLFAHLRPSSRGGNFVRLLLSLSPLSIAFICAVSRTRDNWHHFDDVIAGALIGCASAVLCFCNSFRFTDGGICLARWEVLDSETRAEAEMECYSVTVRAI